MAGIGFQLKKLFRRKGILARIVAVGYTGMITTGPLIMGLVFLLLISWLARASGMLEPQIEQMLAMVTYALIASQLVYGVFSMVTTRYVSDMLYAEEDQLVLPSLIGALVIVLPIGGVLYSIFLMATGISPEMVLMNEILFLELIAVWLEMGYLTAVKDYKGVLGIYVLSICVSVAVAWLLCAFGGASVTKLLGSVCLGYGLMMALDMGLLGRSFPRGHRPYFDWFGWIDRYPTLVIIGVCTCVGLFAHLVIDWANPVVNVQVYSLFYASPSYDIPALYAVLCMIPTTIMFVASTEVEFYPLYRRYFDLLNGTGSISQIDIAQNEMLAVLHNELSRLTRIQLASTLIILALGTQVLNLLPLGFTWFMDQRFWILAVGYSVFAVANVVSLLLMYFSDYRDAAQAAVVFAVCVVATSIVSLFLPISGLGLGFLLSTVVYYVVVRIKLKRYLDKLPAVVLADQPLVPAVKEGVFARLGTKLDELL